MLGDTGAVVRPSNTCTSRHTRAPWTHPIVTRAHRGARYVRVKPLYRGNALNRSSPFGLPPLPTTTPCPYVPRLRHQRVRINPTRELPVLDPFTLFTLVSSLHPSNPRPGRGFSYPSINGRKPRPVGRILKNRPVAYLMFALRRPRRKAPFGIRQRAPFISA